MNKTKWKRLFDAARQEPPPSPRPGFELRVTRALETAAPPRPIALFEQLGELLPRVALASTLAIALFVAADLGLSALGQPDLADGAAQLSDQWLFATKGF